MNEIITKIDVGLKKMIPTLGQAEQAFKLIDASMKVFCSSGQQVTQICSEITDTGFNNIATTADFTNEAFLRFGTTIQQVSEQMNILSTNIAGLHGETGVINNDISGLSDNMNSFISTIGDSLGITSTIVTNIDFLGYAVKSLRNPLVAVVTTLGTFTTSLYTSNDVFKEYANKFVMHMAKISSPIGNLIGNLFPLIKNTEFYGKVSEKVSNIIKSLKDNFNELSETEETLKETQIEGIAILGDYSNSFKKNNKEANLNIDTIGGIKQKISELKNTQLSAGKEQATALEKEIHLWQKKKKEMENAIIIGAVEPPALNPIETNITGFDLKKLGFKEIKIPLSIDSEVLDTAAERAQKKLEQTFSQEKNLFEPYKEGINGITSTMQSLSGVVGESAGAWLSWGANLIQTIGQAIPQILMLMGVQIGAAQAQSSANQTQAITGVAASQSSIPIVGPILAIAAMASMIAAFASMPKPKKFAAGGIVYGNTFAQIGEYPGAANNPEVIAPLSKLKQLIQPADNGGGTYEFRLRGRDFVAVADKYNRINSRTR